MGIKYEFSVRERDCIIVALEMLHESNGIEAFPEHDAFKLLDVVRSRGPQTAPGTSHAARCVACGRMATDDERATEACCAKTGPIQILPGLTIEEV